jgi:hypothetical protein
MACTNIENLLITESGRIGADIYRKTLNTSPWTTLVKQEAWPDEMGTTVNVLIYERTLPASGAGITFSDVAYNGLTNQVIAPSTGSNASGSVTGPGTCAVVGNDLGFAQTLRTYNLQQAAINSPDICLNDLRFPVKRQEQLRNIMSVLSENTQYAWENRYRDEYVRLANYNVNANQGELLAASGQTKGSFSTSALPTSRLTQGILRYFYSRLIRDGAGQNAYGKENGAPVFLLVTSPEASDDLIKLNADIRQDLRFAKPSELIQPLGVERSYAGFYHLVDTMTPRYDLVGGAWVRRYPYATDANASKGTRFIPNPAYFTAEYEDSIIFHPDVFTSLVAKPISSTGAMAFDPQSYRGDFRWRNIPSRDCNPDGTIGFFRAIFSSGSKPVRPELGVVIRHKRCAADFGLVGCYS